MLQTDTTPLKKKILIVDDEEDILEFLSYHFRKNGYTVYTGIDGMSGLTSAYAQHPDVIISDIRMPQMDGIEFCKNLKSDATLKDIPLLFLTADDGEYVALLAHQSGADFYLNKPVRLDVLLRVVEGMVSQEVVH